MLARSLPRIVGAAALSVLLGAALAVPASAEPTPSPPGLLGAVPQVITSDLPILHGVMEILDVRAAAVPDAVTSWYVDPATSSVVVSATEPAVAEQFVAGLQGVRIEQVTQRPVRFADLHGGDGIEAADGGRCSAGFSATSGAVRYIITAGHCTRLGGTWSAEDGTPIGPVVRSSFPVNDFGLIQVVSPSWRQTAGVRSSHGALTVTGIQQAPVGASVCRSGSSTGYQCGTVEARDVTVNYGSGDVVYGLTRTSACGAAGDSGGPFVSGSQAQGILSGGSGGCLISLFGAETYFQPIAEVLDTYDLQLVLG